MKRKLLALLLTLIMATALLASCSKKGPETNTSTAPVTTNTPKVTSADLKEFFPYSEGVTLKYIYANSSKQLSAKVKTVSDNSVVVSHNKDSKIEFNNEGLILDGDFLLKLPIEKNASWDSQKGKVTITNTNYILSTHLGNISTIEVSIEGYGTYYIAKNLGVVKIKLNNDKKEELDLLSITAPTPKVEEKPGETPSEGEKIKVSKIYYYDIDSDSYVYVKSNDSTTESNAPKYFADKFKNSPNEKVGKLMPSTTKIKSIKVDKSKSTVTMDVSEVFTDSMNLGSSGEIGVLQSIANTLGDAYACKKVVITANGEDFITGHSEITKDYPLDVNTSGAKELK